MKKFIRPIIVGSYDLSGAMTRTNRPATTTTPSTLKRATLIWNKPFGQSSIAMHN
jgi:hypothetical protein